MVCNRVKLETHAPHRLCSSGFTKYHITQSLDRRICIRSGLVLHLHLPGTCEDIKARLVALLVRVPLSEAIDVGRQEFAFTGSEKLGKT